MSVVNYGRGMPDRMQELFDWVIAIDAWDYCDTEPLADLIRSTNTLPDEIRPIIADIITGERKQNKRGADKLKILPARERMKIAGTISSVLGLIDLFKYEKFYVDGDVDGCPSGIFGIAGRDRKEPIEVKRELESEAREVLKITKDSLKEELDLEISIETIENLIRELRKKIKNWPHV